MKKDFLMIAIIGKFGSGKTFLLNKLAQQGYKVLNCDDFFNKSYKFPNKGYWIIRRKIGKKYTKNFQVNKEELKKLIISEKNAKSIEKLVFPLLFKHLLKNKYDFVEIPILFNEICPFQNLFKKAILIEISEEKRANFILKRNVNNSTKTLLDSIYKDPEKIENVNIHVEKLTNIEEFLKNNFS
ncbi:MAG: dephospho-CoA kinase [Metamycoplasmataceae bacterium]